MKILTRILPLAGLAAAFIPAVASTPDLPKVEILGKEYYYHEIKKGESIYGIAKKYDWNVEELVRLNPNSASEMKKGTRLYYPTGKVTVVTELKEDPAPTDTVVEPIRHLVKKGETVYSISKKYNIPLDEIYAAYPEAKRGIKAGETLVLQQNPSPHGQKYLYYEIKPGDTLFSLAKRYQTSVEDILKANPGVSESNFRAGETLRINVNSSASRYHTELVEEERLAGIDVYKVKKNDTWNSISDKTGVDVETLKDANGEIKQPEKNDILNVPVIKTVKVEKEIADSDPRELSTEGIREMYDSIHMIDSDVERLAEVKVAMLLDDPSSKKDVDFTRGFFMALDELKDAPYKINLKVIDGRASTTSVTDQLDDFSPNILVATADKTFPAFLADYGETNHLEIINTFDVRNELYLDNPSMVQLLTPSSLFNEQVADRIMEDYGDREVLMAGIADENDAIAELLVSKLPEDKVKKLSINSLGDYDISDTGSYLIYGFPQKKDEVQELLATVKIVKEAHPTAEITVVGRPSWVTLTDYFRNLYDAADIVVPARCWLDPETGEGKRFNEKFAELYDQEPVKSFPNFAASGYDIAKYFIDATSRNGGDFNRTFSSDENGLQTDFSLKRVSNWGGFLNPVSYLLVFRPSGAVEKVTIR